MTKLSPRHQRNLERHYVQPEYDKEFLKLIEEAKLLDEVDAKRFDKKDLKEIRELRKKDLELKRKAIKEFSGLEQKEEVKLSFITAFNQYELEAIESKIEGLKDSLKRGFNEKLDPTFTKSGLESSISLLENFLKQSEKYKKELRGKPEQSKSESNTKPEKEQVNKPIKESLLSKIKRKVKRLKPEKAISWVKRIVSRKKTGAGKGPGLNI